MKYPHIPFISHEILHCSWLKSRNFGPIPDVPGCFPIAPCTASTLAMKRWFCSRASATPAWTNHLVSEVRMDIPCCHWGDLMIWEQLDVRKKKHMDRLSESMKRGFWICSYGERYGETGGSWSMVDNIIGWVYPLVMTNSLLWKIKKCLTGRVIECVCNSFPEETNQLPPLRLFSQLRSGNFEPRSCP